MECSDKDRETVKPANVPSLVKNVHSSVTSHAGPLESSNLCSLCGKQYASAPGVNRHRKFCKMNNEEPKPLNRICVYCGKSFAHKSSLYRHEFNCKEMDPGERKYKCSVCFAAFSRVDNYKRHYRDCNPSVATSSTNAVCKICHTSFSSSEEIQGHTCITKKKHLLSSCIYENCKMTFYRRSQLTRHLRKSHGTQIEEERIMTFGTAGEFLKWKICEEEATHSYFTKRSGTRSNTDYYYCHLDGSSKPHCKTGELPRKTNRKLKKGTLKQDKICLAKMKVKHESDGSCKLVYQPTHNHKLNVRTFSQIIYLGETVKFINEQLSMGVSPKKCFKNIIDGTFANADNDSIRSKTSQPILTSGINRMALSKRVKMRYNKEDAISVMIRVALLSKEVPNPIILYKPLGEDKLLGPSKIDKLSNFEELFMLGIQTKEQRDMMLKHCDATLSVSWADDTNAYGYRLFTLVVPDEHNRVFPVAYFILNNFTEDILSCCFLSIKEQCSEIVIHSAVTPDDLALTRALCKAFECNIVSVLCLNEISTIFLKKLTQMAPQELIDDMYQALCFIMECSDEIESTNLLEQFIKFYLDCAPNFVLFLTEHYQSRIKQWTISHRKFSHDHVNTTILNESIHNRIGLDGDSRRLDDLINILLDIEEDNYKMINMEETIGIPCGVSSIHIRHTDSLKLEDDSIIQINGNLWKIKSETDPQKFYNIVQCTGNCTRDICYFMCSFIECCNLCSHLYSCSCGDKNPLCVHIHKLQTILCREQVQYLIKSESSDEETEVNTVKPVITQNTKLDQIKTYLQDLSLFIQNEHVQLALLDKVESSLLQLLTECGAVITIDQEEIAKQGIIKQSISDVNIDTNDETILEDFGIRDDPTRYEFEYVEEQGLSKTNSIIIINDAATDMHQINAVNTFTPSLEYCDLNQIVLKLGTEELSLLHLKSLDPFLTSDELECIQQCDKFRTLYMYPTVVDAFLFHLQLTYNNVVPINSDIALTLERIAKARTHILEEIIDTNVLIMPMNLTNKYWSCVAVYHKQKEIIYLNPFGKITKKDDKVIRSLLDSLSDGNEWSITLTNEVPIEPDGMSYGLQICHFAETIAKQIEFTSLVDDKAYRKHVYDAIVGGCLKRYSYNSLLCGKCNSCVSTDKDITDLLICCCKCNQWYHNVCLGPQEIDICNTEFICPV